MTSSTKILRSSVLPNNDTQMKMIMVKNGENFMMISFLFQSYKQLNFTIFSIATDGNSVMLNSIMLLSEVANISRMINGIGLKFHKVFEIEIRQKLQSLVFVVFTVFETLKFFWAAVKNEYPPMLNRVKNFIAS